MKFRTRGIVVAWVLLIGFMLASPFRKPAPNARDRPEADRDAGVLIVTQPALSHLSVPIAEQPVSTKPQPVSDWPLSREVTTAAFVTAVRAVDSPDFDRAVVEAERNWPSAAPIELAPIPHAAPVLRRSTVTSPPRPTWHRIVDGDTLTELASEYLGDGRLALTIFEANRDVLDSPHILPIGVELRIPDPRREATPEKPPPASST
jgi:nucleoid-associated protein YgaU